MLQVSYHRIIAHEEKVAFLTVFSYYITKKSSMLILKIFLNSCIVFKTTLTPNCARPIRFGVLYRAGGIKTSKIVS